MPIRSDLRHFYTSAAWRATRLRILVRAGARYCDGKTIRGAKCEQCGAPDGQRVERGAGGVWRSLLAATGSPWHNSHGNVTTFEPHSPRTALIVLTVAHLNHTPGDDREENLKALCQWCHLHYDAPHHKETRSARKDAARPLLKGETS